MADFEEWLRQGFEAGFCSPPVCSMHDGTPMTEEEAEDEDDDPCLHILRLYESPEQKAAVEKFSGPAVWRATNRWDLSLGSMR